MRVLVDTQEAMNDLGLKVIPFEAKHALRLFGLTGHHKDPFDRMLIATALAEDIPILAGDGQFKKHKGLKVIS